jgi:predicted PurR-regulated permease PerM
MAAPSELAAFSRKVLIVAAAVVGLLAAWRLREAELLLFGAALAALILRSLSGLVARHTRLGGGGSLAVVAVALCLVVAGLLGFFGVRLEGQVADLIQRLPSAWSKLRLALQGSPFGQAINRAISELIAQPDVRWLSQIPGYATQFGQAIVDGALVIAAGVYLAAQPGIYERGTLRLLPETQRETAHRLLAACEVFLIQWLRAQAIAMAAIGALWALGRWLIGVPAPGALGVFAALAEFIPVLGPVIAAVPALLMALTVGLSETLWAFLLYLGIHQFEGNLLQPILQRGMTSVPPVLNLFALVVFWAFFGLLGVIFAAPLTIVCMVVVRTLYLHEEAQAPLTPTPAWARWILDRFRRLFTGSAPRA